MEELRKLMEARDEQGQGAVFTTQAGGTRRQGARKWRGCPSEPGTWERMVGSQVMMRKNR